MERVVRRELSANVGVVAVAISAVELSTDVVELVIIIVEAMVEVDSIVLIVEIKIVDVDLVVELSVKAEDVDVTASVVGLELASRCNRNHHSCQSSSLTLAMKRASAIKQQQTKSSEQLLIIITTSRTSSNSDVRLAPSTLLILPSIQPAHPSHIIMTQQRQLLVFIITLQK